MKMRANNIQNISANTKNLKCQITSDLRLLDTIYLLDIFSFDEKMMPIRR